MKIAITGDGGGLGQNGVGECQFPVRGLMGGEVLVTGLGVAQGRIAHAEQGVDVGQQLVARM